MGIELPGVVTSLPSWILGGEWPDGDETKVWELATAWEAESTSVTSVVTEATGHVNTLLATYSGPARDSLRAFWTKNAQDLTELAQACDQLSQYCNGAALQIQYTKLAIIANLLILVATIASLVAAAFFTFGASAAGIPIAEEASAVVVRTLIRQLIAAILKGMVRGVLMSGGVDAIIQSIQVLQGHQHGFDLQQSGAAALRGAIAGGIAGGVGLGGSKIGAGGATTAAGVGAVSGAAGTAGGNFAGVLATGGSLQDAETAAKNGGFTGSFGGARTGLANATHDSAVTDNEGKPVPLPAGTKVEDYPNAGNRGYVLPDGTTVKPAEPTEHGDYSWPVTVDNAATTAEQNHGPDPKGPHDPNGATGTVASRREIEQALGLP